MPTLQQSQQRGSAHVWIIIALILVIIGLLGYVFWQQLADSKDTAKSIGDTTSVAAENTDSSSEISSYEASGTESYVTSFDYPATWQVVSSDDVCDIYKLCASGPTLMMAGENNTSKLQFYIPQSASEMTIDEEASSQAGADGKVVTDFQSLDGIGARKIEFSDGKVTIITELRGGYGQINFDSSTTEDEINTVLSTWKW